MIEIESRGTSERSHILMDPAGDIWFPVSPLGRGPGVDNPEYVVVRRVTGRAYEGTFTADDVRTSGAEPLPLDKTVAMTLRNFKDF